MPGKADARVSKRIVEVIVYDIKDIYDKLRDIVVVRYADLNSFC